MSRLALLKSVEIAGSQKALAEGIRDYLARPTFSQQTVSYWINNDVQIEAEYWPAIEHVTGGVVRREHLRPDIFRSATKPERRARAV